MRRRPVPPAPVNGSHLGHGRVNNDRWESCGRVRNDDDWMAVLPVVLIGLPVALAWSLIRHPRFAALALTTIWIYVRYGWLALALLTIEVATILHAWRYIHRLSFDVVVANPVRSAWRGRWVYRSRWVRVMVLTDLTFVSEGHEFPPTLKKIKSDAASDHLLVRLTYDQLPDDFESAADELAYFFEAQSCWVRVHRPGYVWLDLTRIRLAQPTVVKGSDGGI
jgi:S-DNA-T family DNA segregation ATPase FtsK/SpoIIIE